MEPIEIVIREEEEPIVHVAERQPGTVASATAETGRAVARGMRTGWERLPRREMLLAARRGTVAGLRWLSAGLAKVAARLGRDEQG
jgi:hypothetical protein